MKVISFILVSINLICFVSCHNENNIFIERSFDETIIISEWKAIGPFEFNTITQQEINTFDNKDLEIYDIDENNISESDFNKIGVTNDKLFSIKSPLNMVNFFDYIQNSDEIHNKSNFYLYTNIECEHDKEVVLIFDGSSSYNVWLNKEKLLTVIGKENTVKYGEYFYRTKLNKGKNSLFVKVNRGSNKYSWCFLGAVSSINQGKMIWKEKYASDFINDPQIADSVRLYLGPYKYAKLQIEDMNDTEVLSTSIYNEFTEKSLSVPTKEISTGFYKARLFLENDTVDEIVYKGNIISHVNNLKDKIADANFDIKTKNELNAGIKRLDFLISKLDTRSEAGRKYYHRNIIFYCKNLSDLIEYVIKNNTTNSFTGTILKTLYNDNGDNDQHFLLHINKKSLNRKLAIIFFIPYEISDNSLPESWYIGNLDPITFDMRNAEKYDFALVWPFLRGQKYISSEEAAYEIRRIIKVIKEDYAIDNIQIYLNGECVGGQRALLIAAKASDLINGVSVKCPITLRGYPKEKPYEYIQSLKEIPIAIRHGIYDDKVPINETRYFVEKAKMNGVQINYFETFSSHMNITNEDRYFNFVFFDSIRSTLVEQLN